MPGIALQLIAGGSLIHCRLRAYERKKFCRRHPAMWPAVLPGGRPIGRRAATRWIDLGVRPEL